MNQKMAVPAAMFHSAFSPPQAISRAADASFSAAGTANAP